MQQQHSAEEYDEKVNPMKEEKGRALNEFKEMKKVSEEANNVMVMQYNNNNNNIESITEDEIKKGLELKLAEKDAILNNLKKDMDNLKSFEANAIAMISDYERNVQILEAEVDKRKESEANLFDTLVMQTKQLEQSKISLEESKLEVSNLEEKIKALQNMKTHCESKDEIMESEKGMRIEAEIGQRELLKNETQEGEDLSIAEKTTTLIEELNLLKSELKSATLAEENSKKAMDDLAFALKEVATEANEVKAKLTLSQVELEHTKGDADRWRAMLSSTEEKYKEILDATRKEAERFKNTAERLRLEAEESLLAWNGKETEFVNCIRRAEEERLNTEKETSRVFEMLKEAENKIKVSKEENQKLRDILKQALNEANVAKEAAEIAKEENARLQDSLTILVQDNEMLKIHEAASFENIKDLKRLLSETSLNEKGHAKNLSKTFSLNLKEMITPHKENHNHNNHNHKQQQQQQHKVAGNEESNGNNKETEDDTLKGSIFDEVDDSSSDLDDFYHLDESNFDESEGERNSRKRRALLRRFGDLIRRRGNHYHHRKESSNEEHFQQLTNITQTAK